MIFTANTSTTTIKKEIVLFIINFEIWDLHEGRELYTIEGHEKSTNCVRWCPTGENFVSCADDGMVMLWKTNFIKEGKIIIFFILISKSKLQGN